MSATLTAHHRPFNRLKMPSSSWESGFRYGEPVYDRLSDQIVFVNTIAWGPDGQVEHIEVTNSAERTYCRSGSGVRRLSVCEKAMVIAEDRLFGSAFNKTRGAYKKILIIILVVIYGWMDPASLIMDILD